MPSCRINYQRQCRNKILHSTKLVSRENEDGVGGVYNFVTKRAKCEGKNSKVSWTQVETGSAVTWKYPSCILKGEGSIGEFFSVAVTKGKQQADTGTKMIHLGKDTQKAPIISQRYKFWRQHKYI